MGMRPFAVSRAPAERGRHVRCPQRAVRAFCDVPDPVSVGRERRLWLRDPLKNVFTAFAEVDASGSRDPNGSCLANAHVDDAAEHTKASAVVNLYLLPSVVTQSVQG